MSGIAGIFHPGTPKPVEPNRIQAMIAAQAHRGPDGDGIWTAAGVGLGHRRLAVIDLEGSPQPMSDGTLTITYDGEVYNFVELRSALTAQGAIFRTAGDTEVLLHAWRAWGPSMLDRLDGMFAFAIHDSAARTLFLARDRLGVKPLHYVELADGSLAFASELKGLLAHPQLRRVSDLRAVEDYLAFGYVPDDSCLVAGVKKLAAGHFLFVERGRPVPPPRQWWDVDFYNRASGSVKALGEELVDRMREGVRSRMTADVPVGALLSGGVDSSAVVALMAEASPKAVRTCTIGVDDTGDDDRVHAKTVARRFATDHRDRVGSSGDFGLIDTIVASFDEPFGDPAALAAYQIGVLARGRVTVALTGDGADEALAGYRRYRSQAVQERVRGLLPEHLREDVFGTLGRWYPNADWAPRPLRAKSTLVALARGGSEAYARSVGLTSPELRAQLFDAGARAALRGYRAEDRYVATMGDAPARDAIDRAQYADLKHSLPGAILTMRDRTSMAVGLEVREPLLDHRLVEFYATLPTSMRLRHGEGKWLMRRAMAPYLPRDILHRPQASVQPPVGAWFREALAGEANALAKSRMLGETGWFDMATIARIADEHRMGRGEHGRTLWQLVMLDRAMKRMFG